MTALQNFPRTIEILSHAWDSTGGTALRELLWSLRNGRQFCNLWESVGDLGERSEFCQLVLMAPGERERVVEAILRETGELPREGWDGGRIDTHPTRTMALIEAERGAA